MSDSLVEAAITAGRKLLDDADEFAKQRLNKSTLRVATVKIIYCVKCDFQKMLKPGDAEPTICPACGGARQPLSYGQ